MSTRNEEECLIKSNHKNSHYLPKIPSYHRQCIWPAVWSYVHVILIRNNVSLLSFQFAQHFSTQLFIELVNSHIELSTHCTERWSKLKFLFCRKSWPFKTWLCSESERMPLLQNFPLNKCLEEKRFKNLNQKHFVND